jgi:hypothetical protein
MAIRSYIMNNLVRHQPKTVRLPHDRGRWCLRSTHLLGDKGDDFLAPSAGPGIGGIPFFLRWDRYDRNGVATAKFK